MTVSTLVFYIIVPLLCAFGFVAYFVWRDIKAKLEKASISVEKDEGNGARTEKTATLINPETVLLYDSRAGTWSQEELSGEIIDGIVQKCNTMGRLWEEDGKKLHHINKYQDSKGTVCYQPIEFLMSETRENPPEKLHNAFELDWVDIFCNVKEPTSSMAKWTPILWFCGVAIFMLIIYSMELGN